MFRTLLIASLFTLPLIHAGCSSNSGGDNEGFATYQDCWDEHHTTEGFSVDRAIEICCIDHPIGNAAANTVCGDTATTCETYVEANLDPTDATDDDITSACGDYVGDRAG